MLAPSSYVLKNCIHFDSLKVFIKQDIETLGFKYFNNPEKFDRIEPCLLATAQDNNSL